MKGETKSNLYFTSSAKENAKTHTAQPSNLKGKLQKINQVKRDGIIFLVKKRVHLFLIRFVGEGQRGKN